MNKAKVEESKKYLLDLSKTITNIDSFKQAAAKYSDDVTKNNSGLIGKIRLGVMDEEIDKEIEKSGIGKVSKVLETNVGLHIIFVKSIDEIPSTELLKDKELYDMIYKQQEEKYENQWYDDKLLSDFSLKINKNELKKKVEDDAVFVEYKNKKITRKEIFQTVTRFRQNSTFPEPSEDDLLKLVKNMGLNLILETMISDSSLVNSKKFKDRIEKEKRYLLAKDYFEKNTKVENPTDVDVKKFYQDNLKTLFSAKLDNNKIIKTQKSEEIKEFIMQQLMMKTVQEARFVLYRKLVEEEHLKIEDKMLETLMTAIKK